MSRQVGQLLMFLGLTGLLIPVFVFAAGHGQEAAEESGDSPAGKTNEAAGASAAASTVEAFLPEGLGPIPISWDEEALASLRLPLAVPAVSPQPVSRDFYHDIAPDKIYKSYPIYHPDREPEGYWEGLQQREPEIAFDLSKIKSKEDWIQAGALVFHAPVAYQGGIQPQDVRRASWWSELGMPVAKDGSMPFNRFYIEEKGKILIGQFSCATCHTRVLDDGSVILGGPGNFPFARLESQIKKKMISRIPEAARAKMFDRAKMSIEVLYGVPWLKPNPLDPLFELTMMQWAEYEETMPAGVQPRFSTSLLYPVRVPDLIGVEERRYLDHTGQFRHRSIADLMRYAALKRGMEKLDRYGEHGSIIPGAKPPPTLKRRFSDEQLYALALYIYSLKPPENPHEHDATAQRGEEIFHRTGCQACHPPPLYTNNKLSAVDGFTVPEDHPESANVVELAVGTDPSLALKTRRGTGFYQVPSLKGLWYRGPFGHDGWAATVDDWFDPRRLDEEYVPTGFRGFGGGPKPVKGHTFGLDLSQEERQALIAFLKTL